MNQWIEGFGTVTQRLGTDSQLPFGYCALSMQPVTEAVITPSGHLYNREAILEYLLLRSQELKQLQKNYECQQVG
jgi:nitric oxide synthase-interacting protein